MFTNEYATLQHLKFQPYPFLHILNVQLDKCINQHSTLRVIGLLPEDASSRLVESTHMDEPVSLELEGEEGTLCLFSGVVSNLSLKVHAEVRQLTVEAMGFTWLMDRKRKTQTFQEPGMPIRTIVQTLTEGYNPVGFTDECTGGMTIESSQSGEAKSLLIQYRETDWQFIRRTAADRFHMPLVPVDNRGELKYHFGIPISPETYESREINFSIHKNLTESAERSENGQPEFTELDAVTYEVTMPVCLNLCDAVAFQGRSLFVAKIHTWLNDAQIHHTYTLCDQNGLSVRPYHNGKLRGVSLFGRVSDIKNDLIKMDLDVDAQNPISGYKWFPYSTVYSSPDGTGWYAMPEKGDTIRLYAPDANENMSFSASSVDTKSSNDRERSNPDRKSISTVHDKRMVFLPDSVMLESDGSKLLFEDANGITISTDKKISIIASGDITMGSATGKVEITSPTEVTVKGATSKIEIKEEIKMAAEIVRVE